MGTRVEGVIMSENRSQSGGCVAVCRIERTDHRGSCRSISRASARCRCSALS